MIKNTVISFFLLHFDRPTLLFVLFSLLIVISHIVIFFLALRPLLIRLPHLLIISHCDFMLFYILTDGININSSFVCIILF